MKRQEQLEEHLPRLKQNLENLKTQLEESQRQELLESKYEEIAEEMDKGKKNINFRKIISDSALVRILENTSVDANAVSSIEHTLTIIERLQDVDDECPGVCQVYGCQVSRHDNSMCMYHYARDEHADRLLERYEEPLNYLAVKIMEKECREFLKGKTSPDNIGGRSCLSQGMTDQTRKWLDSLSERDFKGDDA